MKDSEAWVAIALFAIAGCASPPQLHPESAGVLPQSAANAPSACAGPEHRQFDFWLGEWDVATPDGKRAGHNRIVSLHRGCVLLERWTGSGGFEGSSLNAYDAERKVWHQTWTDSGGGVLLLDGEFSDGRMVLRGDSLDPARGNAKVRNRITWTPEREGRVRQLWESSADNGLTWTTVFDGLYTKVR
jgi:hypothetical protein